MDPEHLKKLVRPDNRCPYCNALTDCATDPFDDSRPSPGDASVCIKCSEVAVFADDLSLRKPTEEEAMDFSSDLRIARCQVVIQQSKKTTLKWKG